ncbi:MAG: glucokinase [Chlamydiota bacterium]
MLFLAGDIGGTKTHLILFQPGSKVPKRLREKTFPSQNYPSLDKILTEFLQGANADIETACFGVAGPVEGEKCRTTNLPWVVDARRLKEKMAIKKVIIINDLEANAYGVQVLPQDQFFLLNPGALKQGNCALISAGTGLGEAGFYFDGKVSHPFACEGGHCDFAPTTSLEIDLFSYLKQQFDHVSYERILSGPGLYNIYRFLIDTNRVTEALPALRDIDPKSAPKVISEKGLSGESPACAESLKIFASIYGAEAGNLALKLLALGGVYVGGGIAPKLLPIIKQGHFFSAFKSKGRFHTLLETIPIRIVLNEETALLGAMSCALKK